MKGELAINSPSTTRSGAPYSSNSPSRRPLQLPGGGQLAGVSVKNHKRDVAPTCGQSSSSVPRASSGPVNWGAQGLNFRDGSGTYKGFTDSSLPSDFAFRTEACTRNGAQVSYKCQSGNINQVDYGSTPWKLQHSGQVVYGSNQWELGGYSNCGCNAGATNPWYLSPADFESICIAFAAVHQPTTQPPTEATTQAPTDAPTEPLVSSNTPSPSLSSSASPSVSSSAQQSSNISPSATKSILASSDHGITSTPSGQSSASDVAVSLTTVASAGLLSTAVAYLSPTPTAAIAAASSGAVATGVGIAAAGVGALTAIGVAGYGAYRVAQWWTKEPPTSLGAHSIEDAVAMSDTLADPADEELLEDGAINGIPETPSAARRSLVINEEGAR